MTCNGFHPTHQAQLEYKWGGRYGGANCQACAAGMDGEAHTCGALRYTGAQIRAATNEPIPDPDSPGLTLNQVHDALYDLSGHRIDLDIRHRYAFASYKKRLIDGAQAVLNGARKALIDAGQGYGNPFARNHAIATGADNGVPWFDDPLTGRHPTTWATLERFAGTLDVGDDLLGIGLVYAGFTRDISADFTATVRPIKPALTRSYVRYFVTANRITGHERRRTKGFQAPCTPPANILTQSGVARVSLVRITKAGSSIDGCWLSSRWSEED